VVEHILILVGQAFCIGLLFVGNAKYSVSNTTSRGTDTTVRGKSAHCRKHDNAAISTAYPVNSDCAGGGQSGMISATSVPHEIRIELGNL
jgi:hypothetical protein